MYAKEMLCVIITSICIRWTKIINVDVIKLPTKIYKGANMLQAGRGVSVIQYAQGRNRDVVAPKSRWVGVA